MTEEKANLILADAQTKYFRFNVKQYIGVSCKTHKNLDKLKDAIISIGLADAKLNPHHDLDSTRHPTSACQGWSSCEK